MCDFRIADTKSRGQKRRSVKKYDSVVTEEVN